MKQYQKPQILLLRFDEQVRLLRESIENNDNNGKDPGIWDLGIGV